MRGKRCYDSYSDGKEPWFLCGWEGALCQIKNILFQLRGKTHKPFDGSTPLDWKALIWQA